MADTFREQFVAFGPYRVEYDDDHLPAAVYDGRDDLIARFDSEADAEAFVAALNASSVCECARLSRIVDDLRDVMVRAEHKLQVGRTWAGTRWSDIPPAHARQALDILTTAILAEKDRDTEEAL